MVIGRRAYLQVYRLARPIYGGVWNVELETQVRAGIGQRLWRADRSVRQVLEPVSLITMNGEMIAIIPRQSDTSDTIFANLGPIDCGQKVGKPKDRWARFKLRMGAKIFYGARGGLDRYF